MQPDSALRVTCTINNITLDAVVDTAADVTLVSTEIFKKLKLANVTLGQINMYAAGEGQAFLAKKIGPVKLRFGSHLLLEQIYVAPIRDQMLLGMDLLRKLEAVIDIPNQSMGCKDQSLPLNKTNRLNDRGEGEWDPIPAILVETIRLKPEAETVVQVPLRNFKLKEGLYYLEPNQGLPVLAARAIYKTDTPSVSFINTGSATVFLKKGTLIGSLVPIAESNIFKNDQQARVSKVGVDRDVPKWDIWLIL